MTLASLPKVRLWFVGDYFATLASASCSCCRFLALSSLPIAALPSSLLAYLRQRRLQKRPLKGAMLVLLTLLVACACKPINSADDTQVLNNTQQKFEKRTATLDGFTNVATKVTTDSKFVPDVVQSASIDRQGSEVAERLVESLTLNKARLAANSHDKCPKLIATTAAGQQRIVREKELMKERYCDYYLYPNTGQNVMVTSYPDTTSATLIEPTFYDFDQGAYYVNGFGKHVVRIRYTGSEQPLSPIAYEVTVVIN